MAFPDVIVECAFDNDVNEYQYAQAGYSDITAWVVSISGDLRGRRYEMDALETGSLSLVLDNADGRFTPDTPSSPYFPFVKPSRRLRIRGDNKQRLNIATAGSTLRTTRGFTRATYNASATPTDPVLVASGPSAPFYGMTPAIAGTYHIEASLPNGAAAGTYGLVEWNVPLETGRRVAHTAYIWKVAGTEPAGSMGMTVRYYDVDGNFLDDATTTWSCPSPTTATRRAVSHTSPPLAMEARCTLFITTSGVSSGVNTYAVDAISAANTPNLALNPSGKYDALGWYVTGTQSTIPYQNPSDGAVEASMAADGTDLELYTYIGGTIPGETYTATVELRHLDGAGGNPATSLRLTADDGQTGTTVPGNIGYSTATLTFVAMDTSQKLAIQMSDGSAFLPNWKVRERRLCVVPGSTSMGLHVDDSTTCDLTPWSAPMPIFEGWIESWPVRVNAAYSEISVVANDRLKRIGGIKLDNTWREAVFADKVELALPMDDDPVDVEGKPAQIGLWASTAQMIEVPVLATRGDLGSSAYVFGVDGPADPTAVEMNPGGEGQGYFWTIPYSKDYVQPGAPPVTPPAPKPPAPPPTYTVKQFVKTYYATWSRTYDGSDATTWDDAPECYQGYWSGTRGNTKSLVGFNWAAIKADLAGATVKSVKATLTNKECYGFGGTTVYVGTHIYASKPATWNSANVSARIVAATHGYGKQVTVELGTQAGIEFKSGYRKGIAIGPPTSTSQYYYSKYWGATQSGKPYLTITYTKQVAV